MCFKRKMRADEDVRVGMEYVEVMKDNFEFILELR